MSGAPLVDLEFSPASVETTPLPGGGMVLRSPMPLKEYAASLGAHLRRWAGRAPDRLFLAERTAEGGWRELTYGAARHAVAGVAQSLLDRGIAAEHPVMVLSDNGIDHAILALAAMDVGIPVAPISPAYSLMSQDHARLKHIFAKVDPRLVYVANGTLFAKALAALDLDKAELVVSAAPPDGVPATPFAELAATEPTPAVEQAHNRVRPDTVAKILFTSGSTGMPKGVINTQRMMCSNQQAIAQLWPFLESKPPVIVDWLPWNHTFGGNHNFNMVLRNGGTLYIDAGKPAPGLVEKTVANLREVSPTLYFNVPRGFDVMLPYLEADTELRDAFFAKLDLIFHAGAALPQPLWERLEKLSVDSTGKRVRMVSAWGATETSPLVTSVHFAIDRAGIIGLPAPGTELKMIPNADKLEMRVRGPNITPGYWKDPALTQAAFDESSRETELVDEAQQRVGREEATWQVEQRLADALGGGLVDAALGRELDLGGLDLAQEPPDVAAQVDAAALDVIDRRRLLLGPQPRDREHHLVEHDHRALDRFDAVARHPQRGDRPEHVLLEALAHEIDVGDVLLLGETL